MLPWCCPQAYKIVDKGTLNQLSPTCLSELFRSLIENEIATQVRAAAPPGVPKWFFGCQSSRRIAGEPVAGG